MDEQRWKTVKEIFLQALEMGAESRATFLNTKCGNDADLRKEIESLLATHDDAGDFIDQPAFDASSVFANEVDDIEKHFKNYKIIREIGAGGMGAVFLAERDDGEFTQQVAIKIIRQAVADREIIDSFRRERQILANLNHPNIAKLLDGGVSAKGEPFLAMEYVEGELITHFAEANHLKLEQRLNLFLKVCDAVQFAHQNLIVHRDLKPSNVIVTRAGEPKLLDFGLAKLLDGEHDLEVTQTAFRALTPAYASPEQLANSPITTASDIYSLGIVFYELLAGRRPFQFENKSLDEIIRTITESEPPPPSTNPDVATPNPGLKGDLDNIALMALRKEPERRYKSVEAFADDIRKYLQGLPISARPATYKYRAEKYFKRHKIGVLAASLILLSLIGGVGVSAWQARVAQREKAKAETINQFLAQMLNYSDPSTAVKKGENELITIKDVLDKAAKQIESEDFTAQPDVKAQLNFIIGNSYYTQGFYEAAEKHFSIALEEQSKIFGANSRETVEIKLMLASTLGQRGKRAESDGIFRATLPVARIEFQKGNLEASYLLGALHDFAVTRRALGNSKEAEDLLRETLALEPFIQEKTKPVLSMARGTFALTLFDQGKLDEAIAAQSEHIAELRRTSAAETWEFGYALTSLGSYLSESRRFAEADGNLSKGEAIYRRLLDNSHLFLGDNLRIQANSLYQQNRFAEAEKKIAETLQIYRAGTNPQYINFATALMIQGLILNKTGKSTDAEKILREAVEIRQRNLPQGHFMTALATSALGECLTTQKKFTEAETLLVESVESLKQSQGPENPRTVLAQNRLDALKQYRER